MSPQRANWRWIVAGAGVWYESRGKWRAGTVHSLGKNRKERTTVNVAPDEGGALVTRHVDELYSRKASAHGADIPSGDFTLAF